MDSRIAIYMKDGNGLVSFEEANAVKVFQKRNNLWTMDRTLPIFRRSDFTPLHMRREISDIICMLGECRILAGRRLTGIPYGEFDRHGFHIFDISDYNPDVFDGILDDIRCGKRDAEMRAEMLKTARPTETDVPGIYSLDLVVLQAIFPEISSKQAMGDFLKNTPFLELHLLCSHIPPWLEKDPSFDVRSTKDTNGSVKAVISKRLRRDAAV